MEEFTINYDDQPDDVVSKISGALSAYRLRIDMTDGGDGYQNYQIISDKEIEDQRPTIKISDLRQ